ncbi:hypothetical protein DQ04_11051010 [Trypanosoma grayi]|uniref:hypothetical protein n=1 Tax=Trypanosoma grayi TaxID=71804 RepID=UPI0004F4505B|nr:hypothetical protein DQ04_11051010 [Trypanosoma grayi]KEG07065.1 hypothetical protein DQ04_11051010 [Trypanosoma grayi]
MFAVEAARNAINKVRDAALCAEEAKRGVEAVAVKVTGALSATKRAKVHAAEVRALGDGAAAKAAVARKLAEGAAQQAAGGAKVVGQADVTARKVTDELQGVAGSTGAQCSVVH